MRCGGRVGQGIGRSITFLMLVSHLINLYLPQSRPSTPAHLMQKVKSSPFNFYIKIEVVVYYMFIMALCLY